MEASKEILGKGLLGDIGLCLSPCKPTSHRGVAGIWVKFRQGRLVSRTGACGM